MMKFKSLLVALALIFTEAAPADGGGFTGGGGLGDDSTIIIPPQRNPWFVGPEPISYCIERSQDFSVSDPASLKNLVKESLRDWSQALSNLSKSMSLKNGPDGLMLSLKFEEVQACDKDTELRFHFGVINQAVQDMLKKSSGIPIGYAWLEDYSLTNGRGRGIIWLSPDAEESKHSYRQGHGGKPLVNWWSTSVALPIVLKHEIGHIFGFPHIPGTIMSAYSHNLLAIPKKFEESYRGLSPQMLSGIKNPLSSEKLCGVFRVPEKLFAGDQVVWGTVDEQTFYRFLSLNTIAGLNGIKICLVQDKNVGPKGSDRGRSEVQFYKQKKPARHPSPAPSPNYNEEMWEESPLRVGNFDRSSSTYQDVVISGAYNVSSAAPVVGLQRHTFLRLPISFMTEGWMLSNKIWCRTKFELYSNRIGELQLTCPETSFKIDFLVEAP